MRALGRMATVTRVLVAWSVACVFGVGVVCAFAVCVAAGVVGSFLV